jgi:quercetin dioxygenase-like cupin family protein
MKVLSIFALLLIAVGALAFGQTTSSKPDHAFLMKEDLKWMEGPASLSTGAKVALLEGDPAQEGPFTLRLQLPDGFMIQPHWHPAVEHVTVISGTFNIGMGEKFDKSGGRALPAGAFAFMPPGMRHFAWTTGETVLQLHGTGPWKINYVNPVDDPRKPKQ